MIDTFAVPSNTTSKPRSAATVAVDNFLRKALRVSDPRDPDQIANALLSRYPQEAERDRRERAGLPYSSVPDFVLPTSSGGPSSVELVQAQDDLERDLQTLATSSQLKDIRIELIGWGRSIRQIASDGLASARLALDPVNQDKAMAARRSLSEYARLGRYVGSLIDGSGLNFRRFAQSCDLLGGLILVAIGDGLAANGVTRSTKMVRAAAGELQSRRNGVVMALRSLTASVDMALGQDEWPRGLEAYRMLVGLLDDGGQSDLRALLEENTLAQAMDDLVDLSTGANVDGLRELSTTSSLLIHRFQRLIQLGSSLANQTGEANGLDAPPLSVFVATLQLFVDAFTGKDSSRMLFVARPPIIVGALYGFGAGEGANRLLALAGDRGAVVGQIESFAGCGCDDQAIGTQVALDYALFQLDRAIDLFAVGTDTGGLGSAEKRAAAAGVIIGGALELTSDGKQPYFAFPPKLRSLLGGVAEKLTSPFISLGQWADGLKPLLIKELRGAAAGEEQTERLVRSLSGGAHSGLFDVEPGSLVLGQTRVPAFAGGSLLRSLIGAILQEKFGVNGGGVMAIRIPHTLETSAHDALPRIADSIEHIEEHVIGGGGGPAPAPKPDPKPDPDPGSDPSEDVNVVALYASAIGPRGGFSAHPTGHWLRAVTDGKQLGDVVTFQSDSSEYERRAAFIARMLGTAADFGALPQSMDGDQIGRFFDLAPAVLKTIR